MCLIALLARYTLGSGRRLVDMTLLMLALDAQHFMVAHMHLLDFE